MKQKSCILFRAVALVRQLMQIKKPDNLFENYRRIDDLHKITLKEHGEMVTLESVTRTSNVNIFEGKQLLSFEIKSGRREIDKRKIHQKTFRTHRRKLPSSNSRQITFEAERNSLASKKSIHYSGEKYSNETRRIHNKDMSLELKLKPINTDVIETTQCKLSESPISNFEKVCAEEIPVQILNDDKWDDNDTDDLGYYSNEDSNDIDTEQEIFIKSPEQLLHRNDELTHQLLHGNDTSPEQLLHRNDELTHQLLHGNDTSPEQLLHRNDKLTHQLLHGNNKLTHQLLHSNDKSPEQLLHRNNKFTHQLLHSNDKSPEQLLHRNDKLTHLHVNDTLTHQLLHINDKSPHQPLHRIKKSSKNTNSIMFKLDQEQLKFNMRVENYVHNLTCISIIIDRKSDIPTNQILGIIIMEYNFVQKMITTTHQSHTNYIFHGNHQYSSEDNITITVAPVSTSCDNYILQQYSSNTREEPCDSQSGAQRDGGEGGDQGNDKKCSHRGDDNRDSYRNERDGQGDDDRSEGNGEGGEGDAGGDGDDEEEGSDGNGDGTDDNDNGDNSDDNKEDEEDNESEDERCLSVHELVEKFENRSCRQKEDFKTKSVPDQNLDQDKKSIVKDPIQAMGRNDSQFLSLNTYSSNNYTFDKPRNRNAVALDYVLKDDRAFEHKHPNRKHVHTSAALENNERLKFRTITDVVNVSKRSKVPSEIKNKYVTRENIIRKASPINQKNQNGVRKANRIEVKDELNDCDDEPRTYMSRASILLATDADTSVTGTADLNNSINGGWNTDGSSTNWVTDTSSSALKVKKTLHAEKCTQSKENVVSESDYGYSEKLKLSGPKTIKKRSKTKKRNGLSILHEKCSIEATENISGIENCQTYYSNTPTVSIDAKEYESRFPLLSKEKIDRNILLNKMLLHQATSNNDIHMKNIPSDYGSLEYPKQRIRSQNMFIFDSQNEDTDNQANLKSVTLVVPDAPAPKRRVAVKKKKRPKEIHSDTSDVNYPVSSSELSLRERIRRERSKSEEQKSSVHKDAFEEKETFVEKEKRHKKKIQRSKSKESKTSVSTPISTSSHYYEDEKSLELNVLRLSEKNNSPVNNKKSSNTSKPKISLQQTKEKLLNFLKEEYKTIKNHLTQSQESHSSRKASLMPNTEEPETPKRTVSLERNDPKKHKNKKSRNVAEQSKSTPTSRSSSSKRRKNVETESLGVQTDDELTLDDTCSIIVPTDTKKPKSKRSDASIARKKADSTDKSSNDQIYYETKSKKIRKKDKASTLPGPIPQSHHRKQDREKNANVKSIDNSDEIKQYDIEYYPLSASQTIDTTSVVTNISSVKVKKRRSVSKSTFATQTDDEDIDKASEKSYDIYNPHHSSSFVSAPIRRTSIAKSTISIQTDAIDTEVPNIIVDRTLKPKPKPGPKPKHKILAVPNSFNNPYLIDTDSSAYVNIPAALIYHGIIHEQKKKSIDDKEAVHQDVTMSKNKNEHTTVTNQPDTVDESPLIISRKSQIYPTILIEPETEEDIPLDEYNMKTDHKKSFEKTPKDKGKLSERSASREYFRRSFERRGKRSSRYRASQRRREFDIERYGERLIKALEECIRKGELSKEVSEDTKERDIDVASRISSQFSKSDEQTHYEGGTEASLNDQQQHSEVSEEFGCFDDISKKIGLENFSIESSFKEKEPSFHNSSDNCVSNAVLENNNYSFNAEALDTGSSSDLEQVKKSSCGSEQMLSTKAISMDPMNVRDSFELKSTVEISETDSRSLEGGQPNEHVPQSARNRSLTLKRWVSEPSVLPDENSYEFREYKRDLVKALLLIHKQTSKKEKHLNEDSLSFDSITREFGSDFDLYALNKELLEDQEHRTRSPLVRQDAVEDGETLQEPHVNNLNDIESPEIKISIRNDDSVDDIDDLEISCDEDSDNETELGLKQNSDPKKDLSVTNSNDDATSEEISLLNQNFDERDLIDDRSPGRLHIQYASEWVSETETAEYYEVDDSSYLQTVSDSDHFNNKDETVNQIKINQNDENDQKNSEYEESSSPIHLSYGIGDNDSALERNPNDTIIQSTIGTRKSEISDISDSESENELDSISVPVSIETGTIRKKSRYMQSKVFNRHSSLENEIEGTDDKTSTFSSNILTDCDDEPNLISQEQVCKATYTHDIADDENSEDHKCHWKKCLRKQSRVLDVSLKTKEIDNSNGNYNDTTLSPVFENTSLLSDKSQVDIFSDNKLLKDDEDGFENGLEMEENTINYFAISRQETSREIERQRSSKSSKSSKSSRGSGDTDELNQKQISGDKNSEMPCATIGHGIRDSFSDSLRKSQIAEEVGDSEALGNEMRTECDKIQKSLLINKKSLISVNSEESKTADVTSQFSPRTLAATVNLQNVNDKNVLNVHDVDDGLQEVNVHSQSVYENRSSELKNIGSVKTRERRKRKKKIKKLYQQQKDDGNDQFEKLDELFDKNLKTGVLSSVMAMRPSLPDRIIAPKPHQLNKLDVKPEKIGTDPKCSTDQNNKPLAPPRTRKIKKSQPKIVPEEPIKFSVKEGNFKIATTDILRPQPTYQKLPVVSELVETNLSTSSDGCKCDNYTYDGTLDMTVKSGEIRTHFQNLKFDRPSDLSLNIHTAEDFSKENKILLTEGQVTFPRNNETKAIDCDISAVNLSSVEQIIKECEGGTNDSSRDNNDTTAMSDDEYDGDDTAAVEGKRQGQ